MESLRIGEARLELVQGDITRESTDAIVNAANSGLRGGGGVDGAIHAAAGPRIMLECCLIGGCPPGEARITSGGRLKARYIIHAVGPGYRDGRSGEAAILAGAYRSSLELATIYRLRSIAFPAISTGIYGYPMAEAARIALTTIITYLRTQPTSLRLVRMVLYSGEAYHTFTEALCIVARSV